MRDNRGRAVVQVLTTNGTLPEGVFNPRPRIVTLDQARGGDWLVTSGLTPGDKVLVEGLIQVQAAMAAKVPVRGVPVAGASPTPSAERLSRELVDTARATGNPNVADPSGAPVKKPAEGAQ
jgi:membrane fusion protein (multidrug efflux system)